MKTFSVGSCNLVTSYGRGPNGYVRAAQAEQSEERDLVNHGKHGVGDGDRTRDIQLGNVTANWKQRKLRFRRSFWRLRIPSFHFVLPNRTLTEHKRNTELTLLKDFPYKIIARLAVLACAAVSALPWHGRGRRFEPVQVHQTPHRLTTDIPSKSAAVASNWSPQLIYGSLTA